MQSKKGLIYVANNAGLLEYDGVDWRLINLNNQGVVRSVAIGNDNEIFIGRYNDLGYLVPDENGELHYFSLRNQIQDSNIGNVWDIAVNDSGVFFKTEKGLFGWKDGQMEEFKLDIEIINLCKTVRDEIYIVENNTKIKKIGPSGFETIYDSSFFKEHHISDIVAFGENELLILTYLGGIFYTENGTLKNLNVETSKILKQASATSLLTNDVNKIVVSTIRQGIYILNEKGDIINHFDEEMGLIDNHIWKVYKDFQNGIWAVTNNGISRAELFSPFSIYDERHGIEGYVNDIHIQEGDVYLANFNGILKSKKELAKVKFENISPPSITGIGSRMGISFLKINDSIFTATRAGLFVFTNNKLVQQFNLESGALYRSKIDTNRIYVGLLREGLASLYRKNGIWSIENKFSGLEDDIRKIREDEFGNLWLEPQVGGVWKIDRKSLEDPKGFDNINVKHYKSGKELPPEYLFLKSIKDKVYFNINDILYSYDQVNDTIVPDYSIANLFDLNNITLKPEDAQGNLWFKSFIQEGDEKKTMFRANKITDSTYLLQQIHDERITQKRLGVVLYPENKDIVWYGGEGVVIRHDHSLPGNHDLAFNTHVRSASIRLDSTIYWGNGKMNKSNISYDLNDIRFEYAATSFDDETKNEYKVYLESFDKDWSEWTSETQKDYTNIHEGDYTFKVISKNIYGTIGKVDSYSFTILPPWYRTWWMYLIYTFVAVSLIVFFVKWYSKELRRKNVKLEGIVNERTLEIIQKNELLDRQTKELVQINDSRTRFYSNISHEFRTPLTVIIGMVELLNKSIRESEIDLDNKPINMIKRNGQKLLHLVNDLLDLSKLESNKMELKLVQADVIPFVKYLSESFQSLAETKKIRLSVHNNLNEIMMDFDADKMATIVSNLLSNAFKFTNNNGKIRVGIDKKHEKGIDFFELKIQDNGIGISEGKIDKLFDRFYQVDGLETQTDQGTGIGLSLVKEFVKLMKGEIEVQSKPKKGSTFIVRIPITNNAEVIEDVHSLKAVETISPNEADREEQFKIENINDRLPLALLIDDNLDIIQYLKSCLYSRYQVISANNGIAGIELALKTLPDIIICDVMMPGKNGFEVCETLKSHEITDHIPIIMLTAKAADKDRITGFSYGADAYLLKPFLKEELVARIEQLIISRQKLLRKFENEGYRELLDNKPENPEAIFLRKVVSLINENIREQDFGPNQLAASLFLSDSQLYRKIKSITGKSVAIFMRSIRLQQGRDILRTSPDRTVSEVAYDVGFNDPSWFSKAFKEEFGIAPSKVTKL
ncbi:hybrid sensor histidine kinase/response regulator transcription factor [Flexithrix dorotheae]|uniref:hybrid sensor histidine kinase/response regulator transcription factor n=1 Tax=Flexithrix dorotheae TaxID=70993 RepID=UPI00146A1F57|nr:hybrid sensor histidine kinase/response regulator transcription factor [Flexithrix dorotheae]